MKSWVCSPSWSFRLEPKTRALHVTRQLLIACILNYIIQLYREKLIRRLLHQHVNSLLLAARETETHEEIYRWIKLRHENPSKFSASICFFEQLLDQVTPDPSVSLGWKQREVDNSNLVVQPRDVEMADWSIVSYD